MLRMLTLRRHTLRRCFFLPCCSCGVKKYDMNSWCSDWNDSFLYYFNEFFDEDVIFISILIDRISQEDATQILYFARLTGFPSRCPAKSCRFFSRNVIFLQNPVHPARFVGLGTAQRVSLWLVYWANLHIDLNIFVQSLCANGLIYPFFTSRPTRVVLVVVT